MSRSKKIVIDVFNNKNKVVAGKAPATAIKRILEKANEVQRPRCTRLYVEAEWEGEWYVTVEFRREESFTSKHFKVYAGEA